MGSIFWAISTVIFAALEILIPGLVTIWLALSSLILTILTLFFTNITLEFLIFGVLSLIFIAFTRPFMKKYMPENKKKFDSQFIGTKIKIEKIVSVEENQNIYDVKFKGTTWTGISTEKFDVGEMVIIKEFEGNRIVLQKN